VLSPLPFPLAIIGHAVWLYCRFTLSFRDVEDLLAQRGITVAYEASGTGARPSAWPTHGGSGAPRDHSGPVSARPSTRMAKSSTACSSPAGIATPPRAQVAQERPCPATPRHGRHTGSSCRPSGWRRPPGRLSILGPDTPMARSPVASALSQRSRRSIRLSEREHSNRPTARSTTSRPSHARA
jgi:hypothetical protein